MEKQGTQEAAGTVRVDVWIWSVRLAKTRSTAAAACKAGHVRINGDRAKPAQPVKPGDEVRIRQEGRERIVKVTRLIRKRVGAPVAVECYTDHSPPPHPARRWPRPASATAAPAARRNATAARWTACAASAAEASRQGRTEKPMRQATSPWTS